MRLPTDRLESQTTKAMDIVKTDVVSCRDDGPVGQAVKLMPDNPIGAFPVPGGNQSLVGLFSEGDHIPRQRESCRLPRRRLTAAQGGRGRGRRSSRRIGRSDQPFCGDWQCPRLGISRQRSYRKTGTGPPPKLSMVSVRSGSIWGAHRLGPWDLRFQVGAGSDAAETSDRRFQGGGR